MFTITITDLNLTEKGEQYFEEEFTKLEKITKKPREYHFKEAFIRYMSNTWGIRDDTERFMKKDFKGRKRPHEYHIVEALMRYIEDMKTIKAIEKYERDKKAGKVKYYTSEEADQRLKELRAKNAVKSDKKAKWKVKWSGGALESLTKLDKKTQKKIKKQVEKDLATNPTKKGRRLQKNNNVNIK